MMQDKRKNCLIYKSTKIFYQTANSSFFINKKDDQDQSRINKKTQKTDKSGSKNIRKIFINTFIKIIDKNSLYYLIIYAIFSIISMNHTEQSQVITQKLNLLKSEIKNCITNETFELPLYTHYKQFSFETLKYERYKKSQMKLNLNNICIIARILEIMQIVLGLVAKGSFITKRNLYYKLVHYYKVYGLIDDDIQLISFNTNLSREELHIVSSSRCLLLGDLNLYIDQNQLKCMSKMITNVPNFRKLNQVTTNCTNLFIIQKESALNQINQQITKYFIKNQEPQWFKSTIFITSKGYPDNTCREIVQNLSKKVEKIFYLGDQDIFGVDILLTYSVGFNKFSTIFHQIKWIQLGTMINQNELEFQYQNMTKQDKRKYTELLNRNYLKNIQDYVPNNDYEDEFKKKMIELKQRLTKMKEKDKKIQLQSFFNYLPSFWIQKVINQK